MAAEDYITEQDWDDYYNYGSGYYDDSDWALNPQAEPCDMCGNPVEEIDYNLCKRCDLNLTMEGMEEDDIII